MNKKAGFLISAIIIFISLAIGIFIGWKFNDNAVELAALEEQNNQLKECVRGFKTLYENQEFIDNQIGIVFVRDLTPDELRSFAEKYNFEIHDDALRNLAFFDLPSDSEIFEQMCIVKNDKLVESVTPNIIVYPV